MSGPDLTSAASVRAARLFAFLVDFVLLSILSAILWFVVFVLRILVSAGSAGVAGDSPASAVGASLVGVVLGLGLWAVLTLLVGAYFVVQLQLKGQTLGMRLLDLVVVSEGGGPVTQRQALVRTAVLLVPMPLMAVAAVFIPLFGFLVALAILAGWLLVEAAILLVDDDAQRLGDKVAGTLVVEESPV